MKTLTVYLIKLMKKEKKRDLKHIRKKAKVLLKNLKLF
jgi:hypothetical protein